MCNFQRSQHLAIRYASALPSLLLACSLLRQVLIKAQDIYARCTERSVTKRLLLKHLQHPSVIIIESSQHEDCETRSLGESAWSQVLAFTSVQDSRPCVFAFLGGKDNWPGGW